MAVTVVTSAQWSVSRQLIEAENTVLSAFNNIVVMPVVALCEVLGITATYSDGPKVANLIPDRSWKVNNEAVTVFEHKTPAVFDHHAPQILDLARRQQTLDLQVRSTDTKSILAKVSIPLSLLATYTTDFSLQLILVSLEKSFNYCVLHSSTSFLVIHLVPNAQSGRHQARISNVIPLTSSTTPTIALVLALILHSKRDGSALEYQPLT